MTESWFKQEEEHAIRLVDGVLIWFNTYKKAKSDNQREKALRNLIDWTFDSNEEEIDDTIESIPGEPGKGRYCSYWASYQGDDRDEIIEFVKLSKRYLEGGPEKLFVDLLFQLDECEQWEFSGTPGLKKVDQIAEKLANSLDSYSDAGKAKIAWRLRADSLAKLYPARVSARYDMKREELCSYVRIIFPSELEMLSVIEKIKSRSSSSSMGNAQASRIIEFIKDSWSAVDHPGGDF